MLAPDPAPINKLDTRCIIFIPGQRPSSPPRSGCDPQDPWRLNWACRVRYLLVGWPPLTSPLSPLPSGLTSAGLILFDPWPRRHSSFIQQTVSVSLSNQICSNQLFSSTKHHSQSVDLQLSKIVNNFATHRIGGSLHTVQWLPARSVLTFSSSNNILSLSCDGRHYF